MKNKRKQKWIQPQQQAALVVLILAAAVCAVIIQASIMTYWMTRFAESLPNDGALASRSLPGLLLKSSVVTLALLVPVLYVFGRTVTFRIFGPMYRFRQFLKGVIRGEHPRPCSLRSKDQFKDVCELLNQVTAEQRARQVEPESGQGEPNERAA